MARANTVERADAVEMAAEKKDKSGEYSALQDWMCSIGEPMSSIIVSVATGIVLVLAALVLDVIWWHTL